ncbi:MAG: prepilin-type N-terminal cleavage/methylation domain-containing protein [Burkholderiales bacterium]|nr:prepilin-type N-terminal cleavage/methylation domain-containing protein [Burkholderiales bacterium]
MAHRPLPPGLPARARGFTLVEVAAAVTIVGLLAATAVPTFRGQLLRSHRPEATQALQLAHSAQETYRANHGTYAEALSALPVPPVTRSGLYQIELQSQASDAYTLVARAQGEQAKDLECSVITLRVRGAISQQEPSSRCWPA